MNQMTPFERWLRTGFVPVDDGERKFNPWHDPEDGRFTFAQQGRFYGPGSGSSDTRMIGPPAAQPTARRPGQAPKPCPRPQRSAPDLRTRQREVFKKHVSQFEGDRDDVYVDSTGNPTVGIGHKVVPADQLKVGDRISATRKEALWRADSEKALSAARAQMRAAGLDDDDEFLAPLASVNFQLGTGWHYDHVKTWELVKAGKYIAAAREAQNSKWFKDTPIRVRAFQSALLKLEARKRAKP